MTTEECILEGLNCSAALHSWLSTDGSETRPDPPSPFPLKHLPVFSNPSAPPCGHIIQVLLSQASSPSLTTVHTDMAVSSGEEPNDTRPVPVGFA